MGIKGREVVCQVLPGGDWVCSQKGRGSPPVG